MKYVAFLRGINVGGKGKVSMADLKILFEENGYKNIQTYINSGNVIFDNQKESVGKLETHLETLLARKYIFAPKVVVISEKNLKQIVAEAPSEWKKKNNLRMYVSFMKSPAKPADFLKVVKLKEGIDKAKSGMGVVYMSTELSGLTKSGFNKIAGTEVYKYMTIRNFNTVSKLAKTDGAAASSNS